MPYFRGMILKHKVTGELWVVEDTKDDHVQVSRTTVYREELMSYSFTHVPFVVE